MVNPTPPSGKLPYRVWITERRVYTVDVRATDAWAAKRYAEAHEAAWVEADREATVEQVLLHARPDFRAANAE